MFRASLLVAVALAACTEIGPTASVDAGSEAHATFRWPVDHDRAGARYGEKVEEYAQQLAHQYGRFGAPEAVVMSPDERVLVIAVIDHPSACLCDRERGVRDAGSMVAVVERSAEREPAVTRLFEHGAGIEPVVAVSRRHVAVAQFSSLRIWRRDDLATPIEVRLEVSPRRLFFSDDGARLVAVDHGEVEVRDVDAGFAQRARWRLPGYVRGAALQGNDVLVVHLMAIATPGEAWIPYRLDGRIARSL